MNEVRFARADANARMPERACQDDAGFDLSSCEALDLDPSDFATVSTGIRVELPVGFCGLVLPRSGLAARDGITVLNAPGLIDAGFRGVVRVVLVNHGKERFHVEVGDRIAQLLIVDALAPRFVEVTSLGESARGEGGFGHSGVSGASDQTMGSSVARNAQT